MEKPKKILIISPQPWGKAMLSKHHYAVALMEQGYEVYFMNPPKWSFRYRCEVRKQADYPQLYVMDYNLPHGFPQTRVRIPALFRLMMNAYFSLFLRKIIGTEFEYVWNFESHLFFDYDIFRAKVKLYFPVDNVDVRNQRLSAFRADALASISPIIMAPTADIPKPQLVLNHGLGKTFAQLAAQNHANISPYQPQQPLKVGYVGNLLIGVLDLKTFQQLIAQNLDVHFYFWGPYLAEQNNLGKAGIAENENFVRFLQSAPNVVLKGLTPPQQLAIEIQAMDAFMVCYDLDKDNNKGGSSHKIMEYLSTGKVVISNFAPNYQNQGEMLMMVKEPHNQNLPALFRKVMDNLAYYNDEAHQSQRIAFSLDNTYANQAKKVLEFCASVYKSKT